MNEATGQNQKSSATYDTALRPDVDRKQVLQSKLRSSPAPKSKRKSYFLVLISTTTLLFVYWLFSASPGTAFRIIRYNLTSIDDYKIFPNRKLWASTTPFHFVDGPIDPGFFNGLGYDRHEYPSWEEYLKANDTVAFLVIRDDVILFEDYFAGYSESTPSLSFSMAKSFLSLLIGIAIDEGLIESVHTPVSDFVPELAANGYDQVTIEHLLQMTSGMDYVENDNPFGIHPRFYYTQRLEREILKLKLKDQPGHGFRYKTGENALLALILTRALGNKTITEFMQAHVWTPLGMEYDGVWSIDHAGDGLEKSGCCLTATTRDFAKIGRLYLHNGSWNGEQIVSSSWVEQSTAVDVTKGSAWNYQYQWWLASEDGDDFYASGHLGQYLYVNPHEQMIIVRLGASKGALDTEEWVGLFQHIAKEVSGF